MCVQQLAGNSAGGKELGFMINIYIGFGPSFSDMDGGFGVRPWDGWQEQRARAHADHDRAAVRVANLEVEVGELSSLPADRDVFVKKGTLFFLSAPAARGALDDAKRVELAASRADLAALRQQVDDMDEQALRWRGDGGE